MKKQKTLVVVVGPTASGKTAVAIQLAKEYRTEIVSADSRQIFQEMSIGTAKPSGEELSAVPHHFIDSHHIGDDFDAARYGVEALAVIRRLFGHNDVVIVCGGSGLYIRALLEGFDDIPPTPDAVRDWLMESYRVHGIGWLQEKLKELDPALAATIDLQNPQRVIRALEVRVATGQSITEFRKGNKRDHDFTIVKIGLDLPREMLYQYIDQRMDAMIANGLFAEAHSLYGFRHLNALQTVGYQEIFGFMENRYDREEAIRLLKRNTRRYAKRQLTWFRRDSEIHWFHPSQLAEMIALINSYR